jgi:putative restriction endonuclease
MLLSKEILLQHVMEAIKISGWKIISNNFPTHPLSLFVSKEDITMNLLIYIWNITHGGKTRSADEYRIQITGVESFQFIDNTKTLLLGLYTEDVECIFASFDITKHQTFGSSPSIQIKKQILDRAKTMGLAIQEKVLDAKTNKTEIIIGFKSELFMDAVLKVVPKYYDTSITSREIEILRQPEPLTDEDLEKELISDERKKAVRTVNTLVRKSRFRKIVMNVYDAKCVICKIQLDLPEACHILPVNAGGPDTIDNGILLCPTHHKAFDNGLIDIDDSYIIRVNKERIAQLSQLSLDSGLKDFLKNTRISERIILPKNKRYAPNLTYLKKSRLLRGFH